jgi:hypothetical protein
MAIMSGKNTLGPLDRQFEQLCGDEIFMCFILGRCCWSNSREQENSRGKLNFANCSPWL